MEQLFYSQSIYRLTRLENQRTNTTAADAIGRVQEVCWLLESDWTRTVRRFNLNHLQRVQIPPDFSFMFIFSKCWNINCFLRVVSVGNEILARSSGTCRLLHRVYVVRENTEMLKLWKSQGIIFKNCSSRRGLGNSLENSWKSSGILLKKFLYTPCYMLITYISCVHIKRFTIMNYSHRLSSTISRAADLSPEGCGFESH